jgi:hypothetical protein
MPAVQKPQSFAGRFSAFATNEVKYTSWDGSRGSNIFATDRGSGYQIYSPTTIGIDYMLPSQWKLETRFKGGYVYSAHTTPNQGASYQGPVDTQVSFNATFLSFDMIRPLLGVSFNLPTGNSYLPGNQRFTRMDPDLVEVGSYGAGFNVNPTTGFIIGLNQTTAVSVSGGYAWHGTFVKEAVNLGATPGNLLINIFDQRSRIDPGDTFTANANITTSFGNNLSLIGSFAYMSDTRVTTDGVSSSRAGAHYTSNLTVNYKIDPRWAVAFNGSWSFAEKNEIPNAIGILVTEPKNSNSHVVIGSLEPGYQMTDRLRVAANYSVLYRNDNYYDPLEEQFVPAKLKQTAGLFALYAVTQTTSVNLRASHSWIKQDTGPLLVATFLPPPPGFANQPPSLTYDVWAVSVGATTNF